MMAPEALTRPFISDWHRQRIAQSTPTALPGFALAQSPQ
jgi:hypothetical protein